MTHRNILAAFKIVGICVKPENDTFAEKITGLLN